MVRNLTCSAIDDNICSGQLGLVRKSFTRNCDGDNIPMMVVTSASGRRRKKKKKKAWALSVGATKLTCNYFLLKKSQ